MLSGGYSSCALNCTKAEGAPHQHLSTQPVSWGTPWPGKYAPSPAYPTGPACLWTSLQVWSMPPKRSAKLTKWWSPELKAPSSISSRHGWLPWLSWPFVPAFLLEERKERNEPFSFSTSPGTAPTMRLLFSSCASLASHPPPKRGKEPFPKCFWVFLAFTLFDTI